MAGWPKLIQPDSVKANRRVSDENLVRKVRSVVLGALPRGTTLPEHVWRSRHKKIVTMAIVGVLVVVLYVLTQEPALSHALPAAAVPAGLAVSAWISRQHRRLSASLTCSSLILLSAVVVHLSGTIEAHFLFFIIIPVVAFYEDWVPFATAAGLVFGHHALMAFIDPGQVYNHPAALEAPFAWALIHSSLFTAVCITSMLHWGVHERTRRAEMVLRDELRHQASHDPLTQLANRALFGTRVRQALDEASEAGSSAAILIVDVDGFKAINDTHGHIVGDVVLQETAERLRSHVRAQDTVARLGGDEFAVIMPSMDSERALSVAQRISEALAAPVLRGSLSLQVTASVGVAVTTAESNEDGLLERADHAMYAAKRQGNGKVVLLART